MLTARAAIAARMTPTDVRDANRRAQAWHAAHQGMRNRAVPPSDTGREGLIVALGLFWSPCDGRPRAGQGPFRMFKLASNELRVQVLSDKATELTCLSSASFVSFRLLNLVNNPEQTSPADHPFRPTGVADE